MGNGAKKAEAKSKEEVKGKKKKKKGGEQDEEVPSKAAVVDEPSAGLGAGPKGAEIEAAVQQAVAVVEEVVTNTGFEERSLEAVRAALAEIPRHREGSMQRVKGVSNTANWMAPKEGRRRHKQSCSQLV